jgi:hypothetical protein
MPSQTGIGYTMLFWTEVHVAPPSYEDNFGIFFLDKITLEHSETRKLVVRIKPSMFTFYLGKYLEIDWDCEAIILLGYLLRLLPTCMCNQQCSTEYCPWFPCWIVAEQRVAS